MGKDGIEAGEACMNALDVVGYYRMFLVDQVFQIYLILPRRFSGIFIRNLKERAEEDTDLPIVAGKKAVISGSARLLTGLCVGMAQTDKEGISHAETRCDSADRCGPCPLVGVLR